MKKLTLTLAIVLGLGLATFAQGGGLFQRGDMQDNNRSMTMRDGVGPNLPGHGLDDNQDAPLGTGIALLTAFGAAYMVAKKHKED